MKYFALAALVAPALAQWDLAPKVNGTNDWDGDFKEPQEPATDDDGNVVAQSRSFAAPEGTASGADVTFEFGGNSIASGTGACTVTVDAPINAINAPGFQVGQSMSPINGPWTFYSLRDFHSDSFHVMVTGVIGGSLSSDDVHVSCGPDSEIFDGSMFMGSFPFHNEVDLVRQGSMSIKNSTWSSFTLTWPGPVNMTFNDDRIVTEGNGSANIHIDASGNQAQDLWFNYETENLTGSYEIGILAD